MGLIRNRVVAVLRVGVVGLGALLVSCEPPRLAEQPVPEAEPSPPLPTLPLHRKLTDSQGRVLQGTIVGRVREELYVLRDPDGMKATIPFSKLSPADAAFADTLPYRVPPSDFFEKKPEVEESPPPVEIDPNKVYIANRRKEIERLYEENRRLSSHLRSTGNQIELRGLEKEIKRNNEEIRRLEIDIDRFRVR